MILTLTIEEPVPFTNTTVRAESQIDLEVLVPEERGPALERELARMEQLVRAQLVNETRHTRRWVKPRTTSN